jgi:hypothetical protein
MQTITHRNGDPVIIDSDPTALENKIGMLRADRNARLADCDSMMISDRGLKDSVLNTWKTYRQSLRDMDFSDPENMTWPEKP